MEQMEQMKRSWKANGPALDVRSGAALRLGLWKVLGFRSRLG